MFVVTKNYRNFHDKAKWLIRGLNEEMIAAKPFTAVVATNVTFGSSNRDEYSFGCRTVIRADFVVGTNPAGIANGAKTGQVQLTFNNDVFLHGGHIVKAVDELDLRPDGKMYAYLLGTKAQHQKPQASPASKKDERRRKW